MAVVKSDKPRRGRPVNTELRNDIIRVAGEMFSEMGLHATKMEHIAAKLKISKLTLYSRFKDKEALFTAVIQRKCREFDPDLQFVDLQTTDAKASLVEICYGLMQLLVSEEAMGMERMLMALDNNEERVKLTQLFYQEGPERVIALIEQHLTRLREQNKLAVENPSFAAHALAAMIKGSDICTRKQMHIEPAASKSEMERYCIQAVELFMRGLK